MVTPRKLSRVVKWAEFFAAIAVIVSSVLLLLEVWLIYRSVRVAAESVDRPALLFSQEPRVELRKMDSKFVLRYVIALQNQGSGNAYLVEWGQSDQIPPMYSTAITKEDTLSSYDLCDFAFQRNVQTTRNIVIGAGMAHTVSVDQEINYIKGRDYQIKKYLAAFYESETGRRNASVIGISLDIDKEGKITAGVEDESIVEDLRSRRSAEEVPDVLRGVGRNLGGRCA